MGEAVQVGAEWSASAEAAETRTRGGAIGGRVVRVAFVLAGLHRVSRGAEVAFERVAEHLSGIDGFEVTLIGSGEARPGTAYGFVRAGCRARERFEGWPTFPPMRSDLVWEEASFAWSLLGIYDPSAYDVTVTCAYPFTNWMLRGRRRRGRRPAHVFVTQNGDWAARATGAEYRFFGCDGLVCTNPEYFERHRARWRSVLIPNGVDAARFCPGAHERGALGWPIDKPVVAMSAALIESKRVEAGLEVIAQLDGAHVVVAGDGPLRERVDATGRRLLGERYRRVTLRHEEMPGFYRSADALLHMSVDEPFGNVYLEAASVGLPIVAHDTPSTRWITEGTARLVDTRDAAAVGVALRAALAERGKAREDGCAARRGLVLRRFDWPIVAAEYGRFLAGVASDAARADGGAR